MLRRSLSMHLLLELSLHPAFNNPHRRGLVPFCVGSALAPIRVASPAYRRSGATLPGGRGGCSAADSAPATRWPHPPPGRRAAAVVRRSLTSRVKLVGPPAHSAAKSIDGTPLPAPRRPSLVGRKCNPPPALWRPCSRRAGAPFSNMPMIDCNGPIRLLIGPCTIARAPFNACGTAPINRLDRLHERPISATPRDALAGPCRLTGSVGPGLQLPGMLRHPVPRPRPLAPIHRSPRPPVQALPAKRPLSLAAAEICVQASPHLASPPPRIVAPPSCCWATSPTHPYTLDVYE